MNNDYRQDPSGWYAPMEREAEKKQTREAAAEKKKGMPLGLRILLGLVLAGVLIVGSSLFFAKRELVTRPQSTPNRDNGFNFILPGDIPGLTPKSDGETPDPMPDDWKDYFNSFFITENNKAEESRIPVLSERPAWELELSPAGTEPLSLQELYHDCVDSIVSIRSYVKGRMGYYWGTGIVLSEDGLILTNAHLVEGCDSATVALQDNTEFEAKLIGADDTSDIAVLKIEAQGLHAAVFGDSEALTVGEAVAAIGNPLGEEFRATLTNGIVSAIDRGINYDGHSMNLIQTNTAINEGNSGGALLNMYGQVVGVTNMKMMSNYSSIEGIGFAIPSTTVKNIVNALMKDGEVRGRPALGITVGSIPDTAAEHYELPEGLYVSAVSKGSDAEKQGMKEGDIITAVNGEPARSSEDILKIRNTLQVGDSMTFTVWREGKSFDVDVKIVEYNDIY